MARDKSLLPPALPARGPQRLWRRYLRETCRPLPSLLFLLPCVALYELGAWALTRAAEPGHELLAHSMIQGVLSWFGVVGSWVPGLVLIVALLVWHHVRQDRWQMRLWVLPAMLAESLALAIPLLVISGLFAAGPAGGHGGLRVRLVAALGAGIYEELVFRLLLISLFVWLLVRVAEARGPAAVAIAVGLSAVVFALCHFEPVGVEPFGWRTFTFKLVAGVYLGIVFLGRGVGVSSGSHVVYNVTLVLWRESAG